MSDDRELAFQLVLKQFTEGMYIALFGMSGNEMRQRLNLPLHDDMRDTNLRDHLGIEALDAITQVEAKCGEFVWANLHLDPSFMLVECITIAINEAKPLREKWTLRDIDPLTGQTLNHTIH